MRIAIFLLILSAGLAVLNLVVYRRAVHAFSLKKAGKIAFGAILGAGLVCLLLGRTLAPLMPRNVAVAFAALGSTIELGVLIAFLLLIPERIASWIAGAVARRRDSAKAESSEEERSETETKTDEPGKLGRRELLSRAAAGGASAGYAAMFGRHDYVIEEVALRLDKLPTSLDGFTIVQLSDIHLGLFVGEREMRSAVELVKSAKPDLIVLTGDMIDHDPSCAEQLGRLVRALHQQAPVAAVPGNHDYYAGIGPTVAAMRGGGATVLINQAMTIGDKARRGEQLALLGVDDFWARRFAWRTKARPVGPNLDEALRHAPPNLPRVLLCHNPALFPAVADRIDLQLSGHTHGGQVNLGVRPADLLLRHGYIAGRYQRGNAQIYVNRGFGTAGPPARIGAAPEVTKLVLTV